MKTIILATVFAIAFSATAWAADPDPAPLDPKILDLIDEVETSAEQITDLKERVEALEKRLGEENRFRSPFDTIESRLEEVEDDVKDLKRGR